MWCLGCALDVRQEQSHENKVPVLTYYYLFQAIQKGHIVSIPSLCYQLMREGKHKEVFQFTYIGAREKEIFCMWNLAMYYLSGVIVPKSDEKAIELFESILEVINQGNEELREFYSKHYDGIDRRDVLSLKRDTEHNLKMIKSNSDSWRKYFDRTVCKKFQEAHNILLEECESDPSMTEYVYAKRLKELMNQELVFFRTFVEMLNENESFID